MYDAPDLDLSDVLSQLKRADDALTEFVAPLWSGVAMAAAWMEKGPRLFTVTSVPDEDGYWLLATDGNTAHPLRSADDAEVDKYLKLLPKAQVILLTDGLAFPATFAEKLQGITGPRAIHFAPETPLAAVQARFDGVNLLYDRAAAEKADDPFAGLFGGSSIFALGELLDTPGDGASDAEAVLAELQAHPEQGTVAHLTGILEPTGATLVAWSPADGGAAVTWMREMSVTTAVIAHLASPITSGICLPGARHFDASRLTRLLLEHLLDGWQG